MFVSNNSMPYSQLVESFFWTSSFQNEEIFSLFACTEIAFYLRVVFE